MCARFSRRGLIGLTSILISFFAIESAQAMRVAQVKGDTALITIEDGDSPAVGDQYFVMINGKKLGLVQITKVQGQKALVKKKKGRVEVGSELSLAKSSGGGAPGKSQARGRGKKRGSSFSGGVLLGMNMVSQSVNSVSGTTKTTVSMAGNGYSLKAFGDLTISGGLGVIARAGLEMINLAGTVNTTNYKTDISYLTGDLLVRYNLDLGSFVPFVAGGMGLHMPMSKSSTALQDIPMMTVIFANGGVHYLVSPTMYITLLGEYGLFPPSADVSTSFLAVRGGLGFRF